MIFAINILNIVKNLLYIGTFSSIGVLSWDLYKGIKKIAILGIENKLL
jgi:hypothetical protein